MEKQSLWILTEMFFPDETATAYILTEYAKELSKKYDVRIICASKRALSHMDTQFPFKIIRIRCPKLNKNKLYQRILRILIVGFSLFMQAIIHPCSKDKVLAVTNPVSLVLFASWAKLLKKFRLTFLVHDVFPENMIAAGLLRPNSIAFLLLKRLFDNAYSRADSLVVLGRDMKEIMQTKSPKVKIDIIENWAESSIRPQNFPEIRNDSTVTLQYAGNIGRVQGLLPFLQLYEKAANPCLRLNIWGDGAMKKDVSQYIKRHNLTTVSLYGKYHRDKQNEIFRDCDISLVSFSPCMLGLGVPSKSYNIMASGRPMLYIGHCQSELALVIRDYNIGYAFDNTDEQDIVDFLRSINPNIIPELKGKGERAKNLCEAKYKEETIKEKILSII